MNMYTYTWFAHSVFDEDEDLILVQDTKFFDNRDNCIQAALLDKPLSPLSYSTTLYSSSRLHSATAAVSRLYRLYGETPYI